MNKKEMLKAPLQAKLDYTKTLIMDWYAQFDGNVYTSFSGGKDSTVLNHIVRSIYPEVPAVFANTGLEYPEIVEFTKTIEGLIVLKPKMSFRQVLDRYGFPIISKEQSQYIMQYRNAKSEKTKDTRWNGNKWGQGKISEKWKRLVDAPFLITDKCCDIFKKNPFKQYEKHTGRKGFVGVMAGESIFRQKAYLTGECNAFKAKRPISKPMLFWNDENVWEYLKTRKVPYSKIYDMGYDPNRVYVLYVWATYGERGNPLR